MTYAVTIPPGVHPGGRFAVVLGGTRHEFTCPEGARPGSTVHVKGPAPIAGPQRQSNGARPSMGGFGTTQQQQQQQPPQQQFHSVPPPRSNSAGTRTYMVRVPAGVQPGQQFAASINGRRFVVACPAGITAGMPLHIRVPDESVSGGGRSSSAAPPSISSSSSTPAPAPSNQQQTFMVTVPRGVRPGQQFAVMANGQRVTVTCPASCSAGSRVYVRVPVQGAVPGHGKGADDEDDYEVLEAALEEINEKQGRRKSAFERKVGEDGKLHWVSAQAVDEGKTGDLKVAEAEEEEEGLVIESTGAGDMKFSGLGLVREIKSVVFFVPK